MPPTPQSRRSRPAAGPIGLAVSAAAHAAALAAFAGWAQPGEPPAGAPAAMMVTLVGPAFESTPPIDQPSASPPAAARTEPASAMPAPPPPASTAIEAPAAAEPPQALPRVEPVEPNAVAAAAPPRARPREPSSPAETETRRAPDPQPTASQPERQARRAAGSSPAGIAARNGQGADAQQLWGAQIQQKLQRHIARPMADAADLDIAISVAPDGTLRAVSIARSSGVPAIDAAALRALRRLGRLPAAPPGLTGPSYAFIAPIILK